MKTIRILPSLLTLVSALFLTACGGSGDGTTGSITPTLPATAVIITDANATDIANSAVSSLGTIDSTTGVEAVTLPSMQDVISAVTNKVFDRDLLSVQVVTAITETFPCNNIDGSITFEYSGTASSASGIMSFSNCEILTDLTVDGSLTFNSTWNDATGAYSDTANGSLTYTMTSYTFTIAMDHSETGNDILGDYSATSNYSVSGIPGGGFLVTTTQPLVGNYYTFEVTSGQLIVEGANNTRLRITVTGTNVADVELDDGSGTFTYHSTINI